MKQIPSEETLTCEFKSDRRCLPDRDLIETAAGMANAEGGKIYLGVEDNGEVTGLHHNHENLDGLAALIANRTHPPLTVHVESLFIDNQHIAVIHVRKNPVPVATSEGVLKRRRL